MASTTPAICRIKSCDEPARWLVTTIGHPDRDVVGAYCDEHVFAPVSSRAPRPYSIVIEGPADLTTADVADSEELARTAREVALR